MRQSAEEKKIWFIRNYLGETQEKLGYDLSIAVGDTVSLPAFHFGNFDDSLFYLYNIDSVDMSFLGELNEFRKEYVFVPIINQGSGLLIVYIEGVTNIWSTFPNLETLMGYDAFHQSQTVCVEVDNLYYYGEAPYDKNCGFLAVGIENTELQSKLKVFPNPTSRMLTIQLPEGFKHADLLTIYNTLGEIVMQKDISASGNSFTIDVSNFIKGMYFLNINSLTTNITVKLIVTH